VTAEVNRNGADAPFLDPAPVTKTDPITIERARTPNRLALATILPLEAAIFNLPENLSKQA
jgi:hypothetical protein